jgi:hypothetical protein
MDSQDQCLNNKRIFTKNSSYYHMVDFGIAKWHITNHWNLMAWIFSTFKIVVLK